MRTGGVVEARVEDHIQHVRRSRGCHGPSLQPRRIHLPGSTPPKAKPIPVGSDVTYPHTGSNVGTSQSIMWQARSRASSSSAGWGLLGTSFQKVPSFHLVLSPSQPFFLLSPSAAGGALPPCTLTPL